MSLTQAIANHIASVGAPLSVKQLSAVFPGRSHEQIKVAAWRAARAGWLKRERIGARSIVYAPEAGVIPGELVRPGAAPLVKRPTVPEGVPQGIPASVWELSTHGWPRERTPSNYWPEEAEA